MSLLLHLKVATFPGPLPAFYHLQYGQVFCKQQKVYCMQQKVYCNGKFGGAWRSTQFYEVVPDGITNKQRMCLVWASDHHEVAMT